MESKADSIFANTQTIEKYDAELWQALNKESLRQEEHIELIASENYASAASGHLASMGVAIGSVKLDLAAMMQSKSDIVSGLTAGVDFLFKKIVHISVLFPR